MRASYSIVGCNQLASAIGSLLGAVLCSAPALAQSGVGTPSVAQAVVQPLPNRSTLTLNEALARLARNPRDINALLDAGNAALAVGDVDAAIGFFSRAGQVAPANPMVKAGLASALVQSGNPFDAIPMFDEAERAGASGARVMLDRGLAYDLVGDNAKAQGFYRQALALGPDDEAIRRLALSQAIAGDRAAAEASLSPLLQKQDKAAWRVRAFSLAILGQTEEGVSIANAMLPNELATAMAPYLRYMPRLTAAQQAAAATFGQFPRAAEIGQDDPRVALFAPPKPARRPRLASGDASLTPSGEPLGRRQRNRNARQSGSEAKREEVAARTPTPAVPPSTPRVSRETVDAAPPQLALAEPKTLPAPAPVVPKPAAPVVVAPRPVEVAPAQARPEPVKPEPAAVIAAAPAPVPTVVPAPAPERVAPQRPEPSPAPAPGPGFDLASLPERAPVPSPAVTPPDATVPPPATTPVSAPPSSVVPAAAPESPVPAPPATPATTPAATPAATPAPRRPSLAEAFSEFSAPAAEVAPAAGAVDMRNFRPSRETDAPRAGAQGATSRAVASGKPAAEKPAPPSHPSRIWVQLATGRDKSALAFDWRRMSREAEALFRGKRASTSAWGQSNRLLAGPFDTAAAANAFVTQLRRADINGAFVWTSPAGQVVDALGSR